MNNLFIFDLDGVLLKTTETHYICLNKALEKIDKKYIISKDEHEKIYNGIPTKKKLEILSKTKNLPIEFYEKINLIKQEETIKEFKKIQESIEIKNLFIKIKNKKIKIAIASNCIRESVKLALIKLNILEYIDFYISNEDVFKGKPFPEMYWKCMSICNSIPKKTVIFEDSEIGIKGAIDSGCNYVKVNSDILILEKNIYEGFNLLNIEV